MEESKPRIQRSSAGTRRPVRRAASGGSGSSHVIDLRNAAATPSSARTPQPSRPKPARRPLAAPNQPVAAAAPKPTPKPRPQTGAIAASSATSAPALPPRRFWPAFWRFLLLLIILGALVVGGFYLYINYYRG